MRQRSIPTTVPAFARETVAEPEPTRIIDTIAAVDVLERYWAFVRSVSLQRDAVTGRKFSRPPVTA